MIVDFPFTENLNQSGAGWTNLKLVDLVSQACLTSLTLPLELVKPAGLVTCWLDQLLISPAGLTNVICPARLVQGWTSLWLVKLDRLVNVDGLASCR